MAAPTLILATSSATAQRVFAIAVTFGLLLIVFELVRRKRLTERYAIVWLLAAGTLLLLAAWKGLLTTLASKVGISYPPSAAFAVAIGFILVIVLNFSLAVSRLTDQNKILAQRLGLLQRRIDELDGRLAGEPTAHVESDEDANAVGREQLTHTG